VLGREREGRRGVMPKIKEVERPPIAGVSHFTSETIEAIAATETSGKAVAVPIGAVRPDLMRCSLQQKFYRDYPRVQLHTKRVQDDFVCWVTTRVKPTPNGTGR
jgi:hypothetical protein